jgi:hypothetical protein
MGWRLAIDIAILVLVAFTLTGGVLLYRAAKRGDERYDEGFYWGHMQGYYVGYQEHMLGKSYNARNASAYVRPGQDATASR